LGQLGAILVTTSVAVSTGFPTAADVVLAVGALTTAADGAAVAPRTPGCTINAATASDAAVAVRQIIAVTCPNRVCDALIFVLLPHAVNSLRCPAGRSTADALDAVRSLCFERVGLIPSGVYPPRGLIEG
jgi:hypothetical protein